MAYSPPVARPNQEIVLDFDGAVGDSPAVPAFQSSGKAAESGPKEFGFLQFDLGSGATGKIDL